MNQQNQNNNPDSSGDVPLKRKRGRPRKYPKPAFQENAYAPSNRNINQNRVSGEYALVPPGFERGNQPSQSGLENNSNDAMVGQEISGVIEAAFDAGYLISVRIGNSDTTLSGLVFKPGRYVPISAENDVAPGVPMIPRNVVPFPGATYTQAQNPHPKERNEQHVNTNRNETRTVNGSPSVSQVPRGAASSSNLTSAQGKNVPSVADQTTHPVARGKVVPIVLPPHNSSNVVTVDNQPPQVITQASLGGVPSVTKEIPADRNQAPSSQTQTSQNMLPRVVQKEDGTHHQSSADLLQEAEAKSMRLPSMPFEKLVTEVVKRIQVPSDSIDTKTNNSKSGGQIPVKDSSRRQEEKVNEIDRPILIKPLQVVQTGPQEHSASATKPLETNKTGKMTELLQDNTTVNQEHTEELGSGKKLDDTMNLELEDGETGQLTKRARTSST